MLKQEVNSLQEHKRNLYNQVTVEGSNLEYYRVACEKENANFNDLKQRRAKMEALIRQFETNNAEYIRITEVVEEKVHATLSNVKVLLSLALFCIIESIKENPDKYSPLFYENMPTMTNHYIPNYSYYRYFQERLEKVFANAKKIIEKSTKLLNKIKSRQLACANRAKSIPENATIRKEYIKRGKQIREQKHGPYYYAYWKDPQSKKLIGYYFKAPA